MQLDMLKKIAINSFMIEIDRDVLSDIKIKMPLPFAEKEDYTGGFCLFLLLSLPLILYKIV
jgi:hypothetical protein